MDFDPVWVPQRRSSTMKNCTKTASIANESLNTYGNMNVLPQAMATVCVPPVPFTVHDGMVRCGIDDTICFQGGTNMERIATGLFGDSFEAYLDKTFLEPMDDFKSFSKIPMNAGRIQLMPDVKNKVKGYVQWVRDEIRLGTRG